MAGKKRAVQVVTVSVPAMKRAFRKAYPEQSAQQLLQPWLRFWAGIVLAASVVEKVVSEKEEAELP